MKAALNGTVKVVCPIHTYIDELPAAAYSLVVKEAMKKNCQLCSGKGYYFALMWIDR